MFDLITIMFATVILAAISLRNCVGDEGSNDRKGYRRDENSSLIANWPLGENALIRLFQDHATNMENVTES